MSSDRIGRSWLVVLLGAVALTGLLVPSVAAPFTGPADAVSDDVHLQPNDGQGYAYADEDGELVLDFSDGNPNVPGGGFNGRAETRVEDLFTITYDGSEFARLWITHDHDSLTFRVDGQSIDGERNDVTIEPNETVSVGAIVDRTQGVSGAGLVTEDDFTIHTVVADPDEATDETDSEPSATSLVTAPAVNERNLSFTDLSAGRTRTVDLDGMHVGPRVVLSRIAITRSSDGDVMMNLYGDASPPTTDTDLRDATDAAPLGYLMVEHEHDADGFESAVFTFTVDRDALEARGASPADVVVYRYDGEDWTALDTEVVAVEGGTIRVTSSSPESSVFAVAVRGPRLRLTEATFDRGTVDPGEPASVTVTVENAGGLAAERELDLTADGEAVATETVSVEPGGTTTATFEIALNEPGEYELAVEGDPVGTLVVSNERGENVESRGAADRIEPGAGTLRSDPVAESDALGTTEAAGAVSLLLIVLFTISLVRRMPAD